MIVGDVQMSAVGILRSSRAKKVGKLAFKARILSDTQMADRQHMVKEMVDVDGPKVRRSKVWLVCV
jgi:hypothetical protein